MTTEPDVSGNGKTGTYNVSEHPVAFTTGLVPGDTAWAVDATVDDDSVTVPDLTVSCLSSWSMDFWIRLSPAVSGVNLIGLFFADAASVYNLVNVHINNSTMQLVVVTGIIGTTGIVSAVPNDETAHHIGVTFTYNSPTVAPVVAIYADGVAVSTTVSGVASYATFPPTASPTSETICPFPNQFGGAFDEFAIYPSVLSAGQVAAHYAARSSFAGYTAAVLADSPAVYYHFSRTSGIFVGQIGMSA